MEEGWCCEGGGSCESLTVGGGPLYSGGTALGSGVSSRLPLLLPSNILPGGLLLERLLCRLCLRLGPVGEPAVELSGMTVLPEDPGPLSARLRLGWVVLC